MVAIISCLGTQRQDNSEFKGCLGYIISSRLHRKNEEPGAA